VRLTIDRLGHLGDGIAPGPVYVPLTLPGEVVDGDLSGDRIPVPFIVTPSPDRVRAPCPHYRTCGGCSLMHASDMFTADWKSEVVRSALSAQGLGSPIRDVITSPARSRRRATFAGRRTKVGALVGFHARGTDQLIAIPDCRLLHPRLLATLPVLEDLIKVGASRSAPLALAAAVTDDGIDLVVSGGKPMTPELFDNLAQLADKADLARLTWGDDVVATRRVPGQTIAGTRVVPPPGAFLQATREGEVALQSGVRDALAGAGTVADLFAGCGTFALDLSRTAPVHAVEGDAAMLAALDQAWRGATGLKRVTTEMRDLFRRPLLRPELERFEALVIDPPRAGAEEQVRAIAEASVSCVAMVSCNPVTFARDARTLASAGFRIDWIDVIDQFRWSPHVELVARLVR
jgi:23S rRNA (uracil1939-C5)-methyltransferase